MASALALYLNAALAKERQASENRRFCFLEFLFFFPLHSDSSVFTQSGNRVDDAG